MCSKLTSLSYKEREKNGSVWKILDSNHSLSCSRDSSAAVSVVENSFLLLVVSVWGTGRQAGEWPAPAGVRCSASLALRRSGSAGIGALLFVPGFTSSAGLGFLSKQHWKRAYSALKHRTSAVRISLS